MTPQPENPSKRPLLLCSFVIRLARRFKRADAANVTEILETHCTRGHAHCEKAKGTYSP
jgi:hypothetical protein